jgi:hypothetical protein
LSRTLAQEASLVGMILMPYFSSNFCTAAMTTDEQSVSGMKPMRTSFFSGCASELRRPPIAPQVRCRRGKEARLQVGTRPR